MRAITANNSDNGSAGTITYGGGPLSLAQGDWFAALPPTNFRSLGMILNDGGGDLAPFFQEGRAVCYQTPRDLAQGAINGFTAHDLALSAPPTARRLWGFAAATGRLLTSNWRFLLTAPTRPWSCMRPLRPRPCTGCGGRWPSTVAAAPGHRLYLDNNNTANQVVRLTGWEE
jgi:hypothetical protein